jgi:RecJ-like exonuclease
MSELFQLKHCEECKGTGIVLIEKHDCDCPDCLGTGYEEPAKRIMNLESMLNEHKMALKSSDAHNNDLAQKLEIAWEQRDRLAKAFTKIQGVGLTAVDAFDELDQIDEIVDEALKSLTPKDHE